MKRCSTCPNMVNTLSWAVDRVFKSCRCVWHMSHLSTNLVSVLIRPHTGHLIANFQLLASTTTPGQSGQSSRKYSLNHQPSCARSMCDMHMNKRLQLRVFAGREAQPPSADLALTKACNSDEHRAGKTLPEAHRSNRLAMLVIIALVLAYVLYICIYRYS